MFLTSYIADHVIPVHGSDNEASKSARDMVLFLPANCGIRHVTDPIATRILIANVRHIGVSNICVINLV